MRKTPQTWGAENNTVSTFDTSHFEFILSTGIERKLAIESATASEGMSYYSDITAAFDGRRGTRKDCFVSLSKSAGWAEFHVPFSMISRVVTNIG